MADKKYRSLVTGACSPLGSALVARLSAGAHAVIATDAPDALAAGQGPAASAAARIRDVAHAVVAADVTLPGALDPLLDGVDFVFAAHAAPPDAPSWKARHAIDVQGTAHLIEAIERAAPRLRRLVYLGSAAIHGPVAPGTPPLSEEAPAAPDDDVARARWFGEFQVVDRCTRKGIPYAVLRPAHLCGPEGAPDLAPLLALLRLPIVPIPAFLDARLSLVSFQDVCGAADHVAKYASGRDRTFLVADDTPMTVADVLRTLARGAGRRTVDVPVAGAATWRRAVGAASRLDRFTAVRQSRSPLQGLEALVALTHDRVVSNRSLKTDGGYEIRQPDATESLVALGRAHAG